MPDRDFTRYRDYTVRVGEDSGSNVRYEFDHETPLRVHYRVFRVPSREEFVVRHFFASSPQDRARIESDLGRIPIRWTAAGDRPKRLRASAGYWYWSWPFGTPIDDPLVQLELEMMIDDGAPHDVRRAAASDKGNPHV